MIGGMLVDAYRCRCGNRGTRFYYDTNPKDLPVVHTCLMGCGVTGEPGAIRCMICNSLAVDHDGEVEVNDAVFEGYEDEAT